MGIRNAWVLATLLCTLYWSAPPEPLAAQDSGLQRGEAVAGLRVHEHSGGQSVLLSRAHGPWVHSPAWSAAAILGETLIQDEPMPGVGDPPRRRDGPRRGRGALRGAGIGLLVGGVLGGFSVESDSEDIGSGLVESSATVAAVVLGAAFGAAVGAILGATVFAPSADPSPESGKGMSMTVAPMVTPDQVGVRVRIR